MRLDALSFLDAERDAWRPFEALDALDDERLARPIEGAHGWSGRDLMGHLVGGQELALAVVRELAVGEPSPAMERADREWDELGGDVVNERYLEAWRALSMAEVRRRFRDVPGELRAYLTVVPEARWVEVPAHVEFILSETTDHYADHVADLRAILAEAG